MATDATSTATYTLSGGTLDAGGKPFIAGPGTFTFTFTGGTLQNVGSINFPLTQGGGTFHPSNLAADSTKPTITGTQLTGAYSQAAGATMLFDLNSGTTASDELLTTGNVTLAGLLSLHVPGGAQIPGGTAITLIDPAAGSTVTGNFSNALSSLKADNGETFNIVYNGGDGNAVVITAVPEPASLALTGLAATLLIRRRRNS